MGMEVACLEHSSGSQDCLRRGGSDLDSRLASQPRKHLAWASLPSHKRVTGALWVCGQMEILSGNYKHSSGGHCVKVLLALRNVLC